MIRYRFVQRTADQINALKKGFQDILPLDSIKIFDEKEVEVREKRRIQGVDINNISSSF